MSKSDVIKLSGTVTNSFPSARFEVLLENGHTVQAVVNGKIRKNNIQILVGDKVEIELSPYDLDLGRICIRF